MKTKKRITLSSPVVLSRRFLSSHRMASPPRSRIPRGQQKGVAWVDTVVVAALLIAAALVLYFF